MSKLQMVSEFDPAKEIHWPLIFVKAVDPGCTLEIQVENGVTGELERITSTENPQRDIAAFEAAVLRQFRKAWNTLNQPRSPDEP